MKLIVNGQDRSEDLGNQIQRAAEALGRGPAPDSLSPQHSALRLKETRSEKEFLDRFIELLGFRGNVKPSLRSHRRPGLTGLALARFKDFVWRLVHYRIIRIVDQQNVINELSHISVALEKQALEEELAGLRDRVAALEAERSKPRDGSRP